MLRALLLFALLVGGGRQAFAFDAICAEKQCIGVVDVGSTGSRLHVYAYPKSTQDTESIKEIWVNKITPGFATLAPNESAIHAYLNNLFQNAPEDFPIYFYATAGMRLLPDEYQAQYYDAVRSWFEQTPWQLKAAKTITGREEGVFAWLSLYEYFHQTKPHTVPKNLSVMDMGGASVQVVSAVDLAPDDTEKDYITINLHGKSQTLFVHSFLGLGQTLVAEQFLEEAACFPEGYPLPDGNFGKGNAKRCAAHISKLIDDVHDVHHILNTATESNHVKSWYVMSGLAYLLHEAPFSDNKQQLKITNETLLSQADTAVCHRTWADIKKAYPDNKRLSRACLTASYYYALMEAYHIPATAPIHLVSNTSNIDWTLGAALHHT